jgi:hypothetical protein
VHRRDFLALGAAAAAVATTACGDRPASPPTTPVPDAGPPPPSRMAGLRAHIVPAGVEPLLALRPTR